MWWFCLRNIWTTSPFCSVRKVVAIVFGVGVCHDRVCDDEKGGTSRVLVLFVVAES